MTTVTRPYDLLLHRTVARLERQTQRPHQLSLRDINAAIMAVVQDAATDFELHGETFGELRKVAQSVTGMGLGMYGEGFLRSVCLKLERRLELAAAEC